MADEKAAETQPKAPASFLDRLAQASAEVGRIEKRGRNDFQHYDYVTAVDISARAVLCLAKHHIAFCAETVDIIYTEGLTRSKNPETICRVKMEYTFEDGLSDAKRVVHFHGEGRDSGDKSAYKAMTGALKYALIQNLLVPTGDDPEDDKDEKADARRTPQGGRAATAPQPDPEKPAGGGGAAADSPPAKDLPPLAPELIAKRAEELAKLIEACAVYDKETPEKLIHHFGAKALDDIVMDDANFEKAKEILEKKVKKDEKAAKAAK